MNAAAEDRLGLGRLLVFFSPSHDGASDARPKAEALPPHHFDPFADRVLQASGVDDLAERLEEVASDSAFWSHPLPDRKALKKARRRHFWRVARDPLRRVLGEQSAKLFCDAWESIGAFARAVVPTLRQVDLSNVRTLRGPVDMLYDTDAPLDIRRGMLALAKATVASVAVFRAVRVNRKLEPWLALALSKHVSNGVQEFLAKFVAAAQGKVPAPSLHDETIAWHRDAIASNNDVYLPLGGPDGGTG